MTKKTVLVTGGSSGIGLAVTRILTEQDSWRVLAMSRDRDKQAEAKRSLGAAAENVKFISGDTCDVTSCNHIAEWIDHEFGRLDGLVNCAGTISVGGIEAETLSGWHRVLEVNLTGTYILTHAVLPMMKRARTASIVNISSVCSLRPCSSVAYSVSKAGLDMFTKCLAQELARYQIRVNAVNPGVVRSNLQIAAGVVDDYEEFLKRMAPLYPLGRTGVPEDVAGMVRFLLSEEASWTTGAIISIDGGRAI